MSYSLPGNFACSANPVLIEELHRTFAQFKFVNAPSSGAVLTPGQKANFVKECLETLEARPDVAPEIISGVKQLLQEAEASLMTDGQFILATKQILLSPPVT